MPLEAIRPVGRAILLLWGVLMMVLAVLAAATKVVRVTGLSSFY